MEKDIVEELMKIYVKACTEAAIKSIMQAAKVADFDTSNIVSGGTCKVDGAKYHYRITVTNCDCGEE